MHPCIPVVATTARKMAFASVRTVSDFISSMIPSVFAEARTTELRAAAAGRAVVVCAREDSRGRAVGQSLGRFVSRSVHRRARARCKRAEATKKIFIARRLRVHASIASRVASRGRLDTPPARVRGLGLGGARSPRALPSPRTRAGGRARARESRRNGRTLETLLTNAGAACARDAVAETENIVQSL